MRFVLLIAVLPWTLAATGPRIDVPRGGAVVIDGRIDKAEWAKAESDRLSDGSVIRFQHDGRHLFIGIQAVASGFPSVCVANGNTVRILHASAALGSFSYTRGAADWTTTEQKFEFGMRNPALTDAARAERRAYLAEHGWVASTFPMSNGLVQEMQIALTVTGPTPLLALGQFGNGRSETPTVATWPRSMPATDGCANTKLVSGYIVSPLVFQTDTWARLDLK